MSLWKEGEYELPNEQFVLPKKSATAGMRKTNKNTRDPSFLTAHGDEIKRMYYANWKYSDIAKKLVADNNLPERSIIGKHVSNWVDYRKKTGQMKSRPVSRENKNMEADSGDCMFVAPALFLLRSVLFIYLFIFDYFVLDLFCLCLTL